MKLRYVLLLALVVTAVVAKVDQEEGEQDELQALPVDNQEQQGTPHPCNLIKCGRGEACKLEEGTPKCECQTCLEPVDVDFKVCSTNNVTYNTECELDRDHCLCKSRQPGCSNDQLDRVRLDYYSACKELSKCPEEEFNQFPQRMRDWLFRVMRDLANRQELDDYLDLVEAATHDDTHADAVLWKFCDLDVHPTDRSVTRRELMYIIASIKPMEHCLVPFLNQCDADDSNSISLEEWGTCLGIGHDAIIDKCQIIHDKRG